MITNDFLEQACTEVSAYTDERMMAEFDQFFREQPAICDFVVEATKESQVKIQEFSLFLSYIIFKAVKFSGIDEAGVTPEMIETAYRDSEAWIEQMSQPDGAQAAEPPANMGDDAEPYLVRYVISELNHPLEDGVVLDDEEKGEVFFVLKTVIAALPRRKNAEEKSSTEIG